MCKWPLLTYDISIEPTNKIDKKKKNKVKDKKADTIHHARYITALLTRSIPQPLVDRLQYRDTKMYILIKFEYSILDRKQDFIKWITNLTTI